MLVAIKTPDQVTEMRNEEQRIRLERERATNAKSQVVSHLAAHVRKCWEIAKFDRNRVNRRLLDCLRRRRGEYSPEKMQAIRQQGGSDIFMMITGAKCRTAKSWLSDLYAPVGDRPFTLEPSPVPDLPPQIMQRLVQEAVVAAQEYGLDETAMREMLAKHRDRLLSELHQDGKDRAEKMADEIEDMLLDAGWREAFDEFLDDLVTYPYAVMKGLEFRRVKTLQWMPDNTGDFKPAPGHKIAAKVRRVSPFRIYWSPAAGADIEGHWLIEHHSFSRSDLSAMRAAPGYNAEGIARALAQYGEGGLREWMWNETERAALEGRSLFQNTEDIDALELSGSLRGQTLLDWGMSDSEISDPNDEYMVSVMIIGNYVIRALVNPDPAGKIDYFKACWQQTPGSFCGEALPEILADSQDTCNAAARALINNMGFASGPMVWVEDDRLAPNQNVNQMYPWKVFKSNSSPNGGSGPGIGFFQPQSNSSELMAIYERFNQYADDITGLPSYAHGSDQGAGAAKTASGLSMLLNASSKGIKMLVRAIDIYLIERLVAKCYNHLMLYSDNPDIKGDLRPKARGSESLVHKEQAQLRQQELLQITGNPIDMQILGLEGRREMLSEVLKTGSLPVDRVLPTAEELRERLAIQAQQQVAAEQQQLNAQNQPKVPDAPAIQATA